MSKPVRFTGDAIVMAMSGDSINHTCRKCVVVAFLLANVLVMAHLSAQATSYTDNLSGVSVNSTDVSVGAFGVVDTILFNDTRYLQYPSVYDGYLWVVDSKANDLRKYNLGPDGNIIALLGEVQLPTMANTESFSAYVYGGVVYVPGMGDNVGYITTYYESNLTLINNYQDSRAGGIFVSAVYDPMHNEMLFGSGSEANFTIYGVSPANIADSSAYRKIDIAKNPYTFAYNGFNPSETQIAIFNNSVYVLVTSWPDGSTADTRLYGSTDLANWSLLWNRTTVATGCVASIFSHITSNDHWLACGVISNSTYRILYTNGSGWTEYNTRLPETLMENHPNVNALSDSDFLLYEYSQRWDGSKDRLPDPGPHYLYEFDMANGAMAQTITLSTPGYNDRIITTYGPYAYVANNIMDDRSSESEIYIVRFAGSMPAGHSDNMTLYLLVGLIIVIALAGVGYLVFVRK